LVRFERSTLECHEGTRTLVLRYLKIITPVKCVIPLYDGYIAPPKEGELHRGSRINSKDKKGQQVWSVDVDKSKIMVQSLRLLWDANDILL
jgi:hypothetical protein